MAVQKSHRSKSVKKIRFINNMRVGFLLTNSKKIKVSQQSHFNKGSKLVINNIIF